MNKNGDFIVHLLISAGSGDIAYSTEQCEKLEDIFNREGLQGVQKRIYGRDRAEDLSVPHFYRVLSDSISAKREVMLEDIS